MGPVVLSDPPSAEMKIAKRQEMTSSAAQAQVRSAYWSVLHGADVGSTANQTEYYSMDPAIVSTPWICSRVRQSIPSSAMPSVMPSVTGPIHPRPNSIAVGSELTKKYLFWLSNAKRLLRCAPVVKVAWSITIQIGDE